MSAVMPIPTRIEIEDQEGEEKYTIDSEDPEPFYARVREFLVELEGLYVIPQMSPRAMHEGAQLKHQHKGIKKKGGNPPVDYRVIEDKIDLERALQVADFLGVLRLYFRLRRTVRW